MKKSSENVCTIESVVVEEGKKISQLEFFMKLTNHFTNHIKKFIFYLNRKSGAFDQQDHHSAPPQRWRRMVQRHANS